MKIALLGTRGIPARYGGFETFAEELCARLAERGHDVTVYCRPNGIDHPGPSYRGVRLVVLPAIRHKYLDTLSHTFFSTLHLLFQRRQVALFCNGANAVFTLWPRLLGLPTILNVDGIERQRRKWNALARGWYWICEWLTKWFPTAVVADAEVIRKYYAETHNKATHLIAYGAPTGKVATRAILDRHGLEPGGYFLYVSRLEPENNALLVVRAFERSGVGRKLVIVGDAPYAKDYIAAVKSTKDPRILFTGAIYGEGYHELQSHCFAYIHATEIGGTHPALIEAMGRGAPVLFLDTPENREVAGEVGFAYSKDEDNLAAAIASVAGLTSEERARAGQASMQYAQQHYSWETVVDRYEELFRRLVR
jgi:glycosyltransferase involved in cell wall biosynthesis